MKSAARCSSMPFLSTPSARRATTDSVSTLNTTVISIHALREEGDAIIHTPYQAISSYFYPRPPRGGRQFSDLTFFTSSIFLSTPSARRATVSSPFAPSFVRISIHALREEGDRVAYYLDMGLGKISIHALREEGDHFALLSLCGHIRISIHALREEGDQVADR